MTVALESQWDAVRRKIYSITMPMTANARVVARDNGVLIRSPTVLGALAMELFALPSFAILIKTRVKVHAEACGVPMVAVAAVEEKVLVMAPSAQVAPALPLRQRQYQQLQLPSLQSLKKPLPQGTGIVPVVLAAVPISPLDLERTVSLLTVIPTPCLPLRLVIPMVQPFMGPPPSLKNSLATILRGLEPAVGGATS